MEAPGHVPSVPSPKSGAELFYIEKHWHAIKIGCMCVCVCVLRRLN